MHIGGEIHTPPSETSSSPVLQVSTIFLTTLAYLRPWSPSNMAPELRITGPSRESIMTPRTFRCDEMRLRVDSTSGGTEVAEVPGSEESPKPLDMTAVLVVALDAISSIQYTGQKASGSPWGCGHLFISNATPDCRIWGHACPRVFARASDAGGLIIK